MAPGHDTPLSHGQCDLYEVEQHRGHCKGFDEVTSQLQSQLCLLVKTNFNNHSSSASYVPGIRSSVTVGK